LAAVAIPKFTSQTKEAKEAATKTSARNIAMAIKTEIAKGTEEATIKDGYFKKIADDYFDGKLPTIDGTKAFKIDLTSGVVTITDGAQTNPTQYYPEK